MIALLAFALACSAPGSESQGNSQQLPEKPGWRLTFHDEFSGTKLDKSKWIDSYPNDLRTHSNNEKQYYATDGYEVKGGRLILRAEKRRMGGMLYTSGMAATFGKFSQKFGWFEMRAKFPKGKGFWPAFWLLPHDDTWPPEIDILEILGHETEMIYFSTHWNQEPHGHRYNTSQWKGPDFSKEFHTFALEWNEKECVWYVDGVERARSRIGVPKVPMYVLVNLAVGGDWPGDPDATTVFPGVMEVDWVRVYKKG